MGARAILVGILIIACAIPASAQQAPAPPFYQLLPADYPYGLIRVCSTQWGICAIPGHIAPGTPCHCRAANGQWVPGVCVH